MTESVKESSALPVKQVAYLPDETAARMVAGLKRAFSTPPTMHEESKPYDGVLFRTPSLSSEFIGVDFFPKARMRPKP